MSISVILLIVLVIVLVGGTGWSFNSGNNPLGLVLLVILICALFGYGFTG